MPTRRRAESLRRFCNQQYMTDAASENSNSHNAVSRLARDSIAIRYALGCEAVGGLGCSSVGALRHTPRDSTSATVSVGVRVIGHQRATAHESNLTRSRQQLSSSAVKVSSSREGLADESTATNTPSLDTSCEKRWGAISMQKTNAKTER